jgi:hypothetical protein
LGRKGDELGGLWVRPGNDVHRNQLSYSLGSSRRSVDCSFDRGSLAGNLDGNQASVGPLRTQETHGRGLERRIGSLDGPYQSPRLYEA